MTTRQKFEEMLYCMGLFEKQAREIMDLAIPKFADLMPEYSVTWERPADEYPASFYEIAFLVVVKKTALDWIDANLPAAWFRPLFV